MQRQLLSLLADGMQHSGNDLAAALGVTRAAIWKQIRQLRELGVDIRAQAGQGYSLPATLDLLEPDLIRQELTPQIRLTVNDLQVLWVTESTSDYLLQRAPFEPGRASVCLAEYQTGGRGRRGRQWFAAAGSGICISLGWCFPAVPAGLSCLGLAAGVAVLRAVQVCGIREAQLKWPNDLLVDGKKLAGILVDVQGESGGPLQVVIGVGLNYAPDPLAAGAAVAAGGIAPVSMVELDSGVLPRRNKVAAELVTAMIQVMQQFEQSGFEQLADEWQRADFLRGKVVQVTATGNTAVGVAQGISSDGQLLVSTNGELRRLMTGDVTVRAAS